MNNNLTCRQIERRCKKDSDTIKYTDFGNGESISIVSVCFSSDNGKTFFKLGNSTNDLFIGFNDEMYNK